MVDSQIVSDRSVCALHVDDHALNRRLVAAVLSGCGHRGVEAESGFEALKLLDCRLFDVVILDINMPGMSGIEVVQRLRHAAGPARNTPVIALTSEINRTKADYLALGFNDFVAKPFKISLLLEAIEACVRPKSVPPTIRSAA